MESRRTGDRAGRRGGTRVLLWVVAFALFAAFLAMEDGTGGSLRRGPPSAVSGGRPNPALAADRQDLFRVRDIRLSIAEADWDFFFSHPPLSLTAFQNARLACPGRIKPLKVSLRVRGGHAWHWRPDKPSLRVRMPVGLAFEGRRVLDLINPEDPAMVTSLVADHLAVRAGVAASITRWARVWVNDRFLGMYHLTDRLDGTLLANLGMPELPVGEGNRRTSDLWMDPDLWDVHGGAMTVRDLCRPVFAKLLALVRPPLNVERTAGLSEYLDLVRTASWSAMVTAVGSLQSDDVHNQHWVFDNTAGVKFWPVFADCGGFGAVTRFGLETRPEDIELWPYEFLFPIMDAAFRNPYFVARRNMALWKLLRGDLRAEAVASLAVGLHALVEPEIAAERHLGAVVTVPGLGVPVRVPISARVAASEAARIGDWMRHREAYLDGMLASLAVTIAPPEAVSGDWLRLPLAVWGHAPVEWEPGELAASIRLDRNRDGRIDQDDASCPARLRLYPAMREEPAAGRKWLRGETRLLPYLLAPATQTYLIGIRADRAAEVVAALKAGARNSVTGMPVPVLTASEAAMPPLYAHAGSLHPWAVSAGTLDW